VTGCSPSLFGVVGLDVVALHGDRGVTKVQGSKRAWNGPPQKVIALYAKLWTLPYQVPEYGRTRETRSESAGTTPQG
jgi:hypothetical protein